MKTERITIWQPPAPVLRSQFGLLPYGAWCQKEVERLEKAGQPATVVTEKGLVAVAKLIYADSFTTTNQPENP